MRRLFWFCRTCPQNILGKKTAIKPLYLEIHIVGQINICVNIFIRKASNEEYLTSPINYCSSQKHPYYFGNIFVQKAFFRKYLKEKCWSEAYSQHSFKYLLTSCLISKLFPKVSGRQTTLVKNIHRHEWVKVALPVGFTNTKLCQGVILIVVNLCVYPRDIC